VLGLVNGDQVGGIGVETAVRVQAVGDLGDGEIARSGGRGECDIDGLETMVAAEVGMVAGLEYLGSAFGQADGRDDAGVFEITEAGLGTDDVDDRVSESARIVLGFERAAHDLESPGPRWRCRWQ
jgi:hypothetical protein